VNIIDALKRTRRKAKNKPFLVIIFASTSFHSLPRIVAIISSRRKIASQSFRKPHLRLTTIDQISPRFEPYAVSGQAKTGFATNLACIRLLHLLSGYGQCICDAVCKSNPFQRSEDLARRGSHLRRPERIKGPQHIAEISSAIRDVVCEELLSSTSHRNHRSVR
jgi:hypothetical protein